MATMEYRSEQSEYVGMASNGVVVHVNADEFAKVVEAQAKRDAQATVRGRRSGDSLRDSDQYDWWLNHERNKARERFLDADEWVELIGSNPGVTGE